MGSWQCCVPHVETHSTLSRNGPEVQAFLGVSGHVQRVLALLPIQETWGQHRKCSVEEEEEEEEEEEAAAMDLCGSLHSQE